MNQIEAQQIKEQILALVAEIAPDATVRPMYGGTVFETNSGSKKDLFGGVFVRQNHVTVELDSRCALSLNDPHLEGKGKTRRHIKLYGFSDITDKNLVLYLRRAFLVVSMESETETP